VKNIPDESELLCESCGYIIAGLPGGARCPECGRETARSSALNRIGSPWQARPTLRYWAMTNLLMLARPTRVLDRLRMDPRGARSLLTVNLLVSGLLLSAPWTAVLIGDPARAARGGPYRSLIFASSLTVQAAAIAGTLALLTAIEARGIRFFGTRRGWRITRNIAWQVCAHASVGWIIAACLTLLSLVVWLNLSSFGLTGWLERRSNAGSSILAVVPLSGFFLGMLVFETLAYIGMRRCRFANAPSSTAREPAE